MGPEELGDQPEIGQDWKAPDEQVEDASPEAIEAQELLLRGEIAAGVEEMQANIDDLEALAEDEQMTETIRDRILSSIDAIANQVQARFMKQLGGSALLGGILGLQEYLVDSGHSAIMQGSLISQANEVALAGVAVYASMKGLQFARHKVRELVARHGVDKGTIEGASGAASYISRESHEVGIERHELDLTFAESAALFDESSRVYDQERRKTRGEDKAWKIAHQRVAREASSILGREAPTKA